LSLNQNPEQLARDHIDLLLSQSGWVVQNMKSINLNAAPGVAVREFPTDTGPADYILFVNGKACGIIEAALANFRNVLDGLGGK
jgi:type I restriction enzyme R subunit